MAFLIFAILSPKLVTKKRSPTSKLEIGPARFCQSTIEPAPRVPHAAHKFEGGS